MARFPGALGQTLRIAAFAAIATMTAATAPVPAAVTPRPTPTPEPRLTGGFGKTPVPGERRRVADKKKAVKLTNDTLVTETDKGKVSTSNVQPQPTPEPRANPGETPGPSGISSQDREEYWRGESRRLRQLVADLKDTIERLEAETKRLEGEFYSWDDGSYRDRVIKPSWDKAREELETARRELPLAEKELAELPDRARRAGALPGWLRE